MRRRSSGGSTRRTTRWGWEADAGRVFPMRQTCIEPERAFKHLWQASRTEEISQHLRRNFIEPIGRCLPAAKRLCEKGNRKNWAEFGDEKQNIGNNSRSWTSGTSYRQAYHEHHRRLRQPDLRPAAATSGRQMRIRRRCKAEKKNRPGSCGSCARRFAAIKRGAHAFGCVSRGDRKRCTSKVTSPSLRMVS